MANQNALHVSAPVRLGQRHLLERNLAETAKRGFSFDKLDGVHFARLVLVPGAFNKSGQWLSDSLVLATNFDGDHDAHLNQIVERCAQELDLLFSSCAGYPGPAPSTAERQAYFRSHSQRVAAHYVNTRGRSLEQLIQEAELYSALKNHFSVPGTDKISATQAYAEVLDLVNKTPSLSFALTPAEGDRERVKRMVKLVAAGIAGVVLLLAALILVPWIILVFAILFVLILRLHEIGNMPENYRPPNQRLATRQNEEEFYSQNQLSSVGFIQLGFFRRWLLFACLWVLEFGNKYIFYRGNLAGVDTIHFARWLMIDKNQRVLFLSNFDGSPESYQDDFIERVAFGLNLVFSNGVGWPVTRLLIFGGSRDEQAFRAFYRDHQIATQIWYVAKPYHGATAVNLTRNAKVRAGIAGGLSGNSIKDWVALL